MYRQRMSAKWTKKMEWPLWPRWSLLGEVELQLKAEEWRAVGHRMIAPRTGNIAHSRSTNMWHILGSGRIAVNLNSRWRMKQDEVVKINKGQIIKVSSSELGSLNFIQVVVMEGIWAGNKFCLKSGKSFYPSSPYVPNQQCDTRQQGGKH